MPQIWWKKNKSKKKEYIISLLEWREYIEVWLANKEELQHMWRDEEIQEENLWRKWKEFAEIWNKSNSKQRWFILPMSINGLISHLWWDVKKESKKHIISLLEDTTQ